MIQDITGGLEVLAMKGKIKVDNTLEARLGNNRLGPSKILPPALWAWDLALKLVKITLASRMDS